MNEQHLYCFLYIKKKSEHDCNAIQCIEYEHGQFQFSKELSEH